MPTTPFILVVTKPRLPEQYTIQKQNLDSYLGSLPQLEVIRHPVFSLTPIIESFTQVKAFIQEIQQTKQQGILVCVSPSVIEFVVSALGVWPDQLICAAMGYQSAQVALSLGVPSRAIVAPKFSDHRVSEDAQGLEVLLKQMFSPSATRILILNGKPYASPLQKQLTHIGFNAISLRVYQRQAIDYHAEDYTRLFNHKKSLVFWVTSSDAIDELADHFKKFLSNHDLDLFSQAYCLVTHPRIFQSASTVGFQRIEMIPTGIEAVIIWLKANLDSTIDLTGTYNLHKGFTVINSDSSNQTAKTNSDTQTLSDFTKPTSAATSVGGLNAIHAPSSVLATQSRQPLNQSRTALVALVMVTIAWLGLIGLAFYGQNRLEHAKQLLLERMQEDKTRLAVMQETVQNVDGLYRDLKVRFEQLQTDQKEAQGQQELLQQVYEELIGSRSAVSLSEIHQLVSIAKRQLYVLGNIEGAKVALQQAIELLEKTEKPSLIAIRTSIAKDLAALNQVKQIDLIELAIQLDSIINSVDSMPTLSATDSMLIDSFTNKKNDFQLNMPLSWSYDNLVESALETIRFAFVSIWQDVKSLIEITAVDDPKALMLSASQRQDLKNTLRLSLLNARLSLMSRHAKLLTSDINRSRAMLSTYFDQTNPQVHSALRVLEQIGQVQIQIALPELTHSTASIALAMESERKLN